MRVKRPPQVGIVISSFYPLGGGAERQCLKLSTALHGTESVAWVLTQHLSPDSPRLEMIDGILVKRVGAVAAWRRLARRFKGKQSRRGETSYEQALQRRGIGRLLYGLKQACIQSLLALETAAFLWKQRGSISVLVCFFFSPLEAIVCSLARIWGIPVVVRTANSGAYLFQDLLGRWQQKELLQADRLVAISSDIRAELQWLGAPDSRIRVIPNGVDLPSVQWDPELQHDVAAVCVANLSQQPLKGLDILVAAWPLVVSARGPARLMICGRGDSTTLRELADRHNVGGLIEFVGDVRDLTSILLRSEVFVLPSRVEGMSNALLEAMALGMPCVATAVSGSVDLIRNGRNGILVPSEDHRALAHALVSTLTSQTVRKTLGREARRTIQHGYTTERMVDQYRGLLGELDTRFLRLARENHDSSLAKP